MNIILGATGQIGTMLVDHLLKKGQPVKAVIRNSSKAQELENKGIEVCIADFADVEALKKAFQNGTTAFLVTPENKKCKNFLNESQTLIRHYREAIGSSKINKIVGLSSVGAQHKSETGNLIASHMLEHAFSDLKIEQIFVRPVYYFSNWLGYLDVVKAHGILPTFFPPEMKLPMIAPSDVAAFLSEVITCKTPQEKLYEIAGPRAYRSLDIAKIFEEVLHKEVTIQQLPPNEWESALLQAGFSIDGAKNLIRMTQAVIEGKTDFTTTNPIRFSTDFKTYLEGNV